MEVESTERAREDRPSPPSGGAAAFRPRLIEASQRAGANRRVERKPRWWRDRRRRRMLGLADVLVALGIGLAVTLTQGESVLPALASVPVGALAAKLLGLYDVDHRAIRHLTVDEAPVLLAWSAITTALTILITPGDVEVGQYVLFLSVAALAVFSLRASARALWRLTTPAERTLVVGEGGPAIAIARKIELFDDMHLELDRTEHPHELDRRGDAHMDHVLMGIDRVVLAWSNAAPAFIEHLLTHCRRLEVKLSVVSPFRGQARPAEKLSHVADLPVLEYNTWDVPRSTMALKRVLDLAGAAIALVLLAPVFLAAAIAIKLDDRGPVFYRQIRAGRHGRPFSMIKFRSMGNDAEERLGEFVAIERLDTPVFKLRSDPRVTRVGRVLRRFSIDELPQLFNVLRGEMSLVGPRPEELALVERYDDQDKFRFVLRPGLTGPMQVLGRGELNFGERLAVDLDYLETLSVTRDMRLIALTLPAVIRGKGAY
ncbi:MAG: sugar transferase [Actinomycetota bacterium]|nr:sugar transferase [Actinomycetota bacterium]